MTTWQGTPRSADQILQEEIIHRLDCGQPISKIIADLFVSYERVHDAKIDLAIERYASRRIRRKDQQ